MPDLSDANLWFGGLAILMAAIVAAIVSNRASKSLARKSDLETLEGSYTKLQATYLTENERLNNELEKERNARTKAELLCQAQITELQRQLTALLEQGASMVRKVVIVGADVPLPITAADKVEPLPVVIKGPLPIPMTQAQVAAAVAAQADAEDAKE